VPRNLEIGTQFWDSENAQCNLKIAQIPRLRGTYTSLVGVHDALMCTDIELPNYPQLVLYEAICSFLTCSLCLLMMGSECVWALGEGSNFQLVRGPQN